MMNKMMLRNISKLAKSRAVVANQMRAFSLMTTQNRNMMSVMRAQQNMINMPFFNMV